MSDNDETLNSGEEALRDIKESLKAGSADVASEARAATEDIRDAATDATDIGRYASAQVGRHARAAATSAKVAIGDAAEMAGDAGSAFAREKRETVQQWHVRADAYVRSNPVSALAAAAGVGLLFGFFVRRSRE